MNPALPLYAAATAGFFFCALLYYKGRFRLAGLAGFVVAVLLGWTTALVLDPLAATFSLVLLLLVPGLVLLAHVYDSDRGIFLLPTIYSIPLAFLSAAALWLLTGLALVI